MTKSQIDIVHLDKNLKKTAKSQNDIVHVENDEK